MSSPGSSRNERGSAMTSVRLPISFCLSVSTTVALFWLLGMLVAGHPPGQLIDIRKVQIASRLIPEPQDPPPPLPVKPPKPIPHPPDNEFDPIVSTKNVVIGGDTWKVLPEGLKFGEEELQPTTHDQARLPQSSGSDRGLVPQLRIEPDYPESARAHRIEGWVKFSLTVASDGSVKDVVILDAQPARIWDSATIRAVSSWKYQPAIRDGRPVEQAGVVAIYRFELD
jgi:protein TonB